LVAAAACAGIALRSACTQDEVVAAVGMHA
jgi:hypothetical protein